MVIGNKPENARCESAQAAAQRKKNVHFNFYEGIKVATGVPQCLCMTKHMNSESHSAYLHIETYFVSFFKSMKERTKAA